MSLDISLHQNAEYYTEVFSTNITHNLGKMAKAVICFSLGNNHDVITLYHILWLGSGQSAKVIAPMLEVGLNELKECRELYEEYNPENGWGSYEGLIKHTEELLEACLDFPETTLYCHR